LKDFEDEILKLIQNIKFQCVHLPFQNKLSADTKRIRDSQQLLIPADKTSNFYELQVERYNKLLEENITKDYSKSAATIDQKISTVDKQIAEKLSLDDRIPVSAKKQAYITLKDHKPNFINRPTCRLINPSKSNLGIISKRILEKINSSVRAQSQLNQWRSTQDVIGWFNSLTDKNAYSFICFDICDFYPSITSELLDQALVFAQKYLQISPLDHEIIAQTKKSLLHNQGQTWSKTNNPDFDVTMGSYDGAEVCELVGLFLLSELCTLKINIGLYRDDGLAVCKGSPRYIENIKKHLCNVFSKHNLRITIEANKKSANYLDINLDLRTGHYKPYLKSNNTPIYVHSQSNHPPAIVKNLPESINRRLSSITANETLFKTSVLPYQTALSNSGYSYQVHIIYV
jgi:hypothetical protein